LARRLLVVPAVVCTLQAVALGANAVGSLIDPGQGIGSAAVEAVVLLLLALALVAVAVGLLRAKGWARGPVIALQLIALLTALAYAGLDTWLGWVLALMSAASALVVLSRPVADLLEGGATPDAS
jgi:hypothetical protein